MPGSTSTPFDFNTYGKPFLAFPVLNTPLQFNLAHSREHALYAFTDSRQVGIDVSCQSGESTVLLQSREDPHEIRCWALRELAPGEGYAGALAIEGSGWSLN